MTPKAPKMMVSPIATSTSKAPSVSPLNNWAQSSGQLMQNSEGFSLRTSGRRHLAAGRLAGRHHVRTGSKSHHLEQVLAIAHFGGFLADHHGDRAHLLMIAPAVIDLSERH